MSDPIVIERDGPLTHVRLNRDEKRNAFSAELVDTLLKTTRDAASDGTRLFVISGEGKAFSAGFDLDGLDESTDGDMLLRFVRVEQLLQSLAHAPFATLALAHGACFGAAADVVASCRSRIAAPDAAFRMPGPLFDVVLGTRRLTELVGADRARQLIIRDRPFDAEEALETGFVQRIADKKTWPQHIADALANALLLSPGVYRVLSERMTKDTRDADLAALVRSVSEGSIRARLRDYVEQVKRARSQRG